MFGPPGHLYVYRSYGMHWCANAVCGPAGTAGAVLVRALAPVAGVEMMRAARMDRRDRDLASGPGRLCQALGIDGSYDGADIVAGRGGVAIAMDGTAPPVAAANGPRVGISAAVDWQWRWWVEGEPCVSRARTSGTRTPGAIPTGHRTPGSERR